jgi:hypothetical protein
MQMILWFFCKGSNSNLQALIHLFTDYANASGQCINANKSVLFVGAMWIELE